MISNEDLENMWNYCLSLESDLSETSRFVEPTQLEVYSFEFQKLIVLSCCEVETAFIKLCEIILKTPNFTHDICQYKSTILGQFPKITETVVHVKRAHIQIKPFECWGTRKLFWWDSYQHVKHGRSEFFQMATYKNALYSLSALYVLNLYLQKTSNPDFDNSDSIYLGSNYIPQYLLAAPPEKLPDFS